MNRKDDELPYIEPVPYYGERREQPAEGKPRATANAASNASRADEEDGAAFAEPQPYYALNDQQVAVLRALASKLEAELRGLEANNAPWAQRHRIEVELNEVGGSEAKSYKSADLLSANGTANSDAFTNSHQLRRRCISASRRRRRCPSKRSRMRLMEKTNPSPTNSTLSRSERFAKAKGPVERFDQAPAS